MKKVRCINANGLTSFKQGEICEVLSEEGNTYQLKGGVGSYTKDRFEDVIEPDFKVGDKVVFARKTKCELEQWNDRFTVGKTYTVASILRNPCVNSDNGYAYFMPPECFDLVPEPKPEPKFKVGDFVKGIGNRYGVTNSHMTKGVVRYVGGEDEIGVQRLERDGEPISDDIVFDVSGEYFELWEESKPIVKERATVKKVRCIDATLSSNKLKTNTIYEVENSYTSNFGTPFYNLKGFGDFNFMQNRFEDVIEEKYPQIVYLADGTKVVFNPPYTIVERNGLVGKVKCYHKDEYTKWGGYTEALKVMKPCSK